MQIVTVDNKIINYFERLQNVAKKIQRISVMQNVANSEEAGEVSYNGRSIGITSYVELTRQIPGLLRDMSLCSLKGEVYSCDKKILQDKFAKLLNFLLAWLCSIPLQNGNQIPISLLAFQIKSALKWLKPLMKSMDIFDSDSQRCLNNIINQL
jgi:hypothetical protein